MNAQPAAGFLSRRQLLWAGWVLLVLLLLLVLPGWAYGVVVPASALVLALIPGTVPTIDRSVDRQDLLVIAVVYVAVVALFRLAFVVFTSDVVAGLFLCFAAGMLIGVAVPIVYTVWLRQRPMRDLGFRRDNWRQTLALGGVFAAVQIVLTFWGFSFPEPESWVPLLVLALTVGLFEAVFFRGFVQTRLEASFGPAIGLGGASGLYALYHVGYGMAGSEMLFLLGIGVVYAIAFATVRNLFVIWPLLTPVGGFFSTVSVGDISMPWIAILGFADVLGLMAFVVWLAFRHQRKLQRQPGHATTEPPATPVGR